MERIILEPLRGQNYPNFQTQLRPSFARDNSHPVHAAAIIATKLEFPWPINGRGGASV